MLRAEGEARDVFRAGFGHDEDVVLAVTAGARREHHADRRAGHRLRIAAVRVTADADERRVESLAAHQPCRNAQMQACRDADRIRHAMDARDLAPGSRQHETLLDKPIGVSARSTTKSTIVSSAHGPSAVSSPTRYERAIVRSSR